MSLPKYLYRGDGDPENKRQIRTSIKGSYLRTHLLNGGDGKRIFRENLWDLVNAHILSKYPKSDFLSFTSDKNAAFRFGLNIHNISEEIIEECTSEYYDDDENSKPWDFAIFTLSTSCLDLVNEPAPGIYEALFSPTLLEFQRQGLYRVFLLDIVTALKAVGDESYKLAAEYSGFDHEWLVLPAMPKLFNTGTIEYSALLDMACISDTRKYEINKELLDQYNTISY